MSRDGFLQWTQWWQLLIREEHEAQAVELFMSLPESRQAELLGWLAGRSRRNREKIEDLGEELIQLQAELIQLEAEATKEHKMRQATFDDLRREMEGMKKWMQEEDQKALAKEVGQWGKEDLAQHEITQFLRYLQACGGHDAPFDLKAHLPRIQRLLDAHDKVIER